MVSFLKDKSSNTQKPLRGFGSLTFDIPSVTEIFWERLPGKYREPVTFWWYQGVNSPLPKNPYFSILLVSFFPPSWYREARPNLIPFWVDINFPPSAMLWSFPSQLLHLVVLPIGDLPINTPVCYCGCPLGLEAKCWVGGDPSLIALCCYYILVQWFSKCGPLTATSRITWEAVRNTKCQNFSLHQWNQKL